MLPPPPPTPLTGGCEAAAGSAGRCFCLRGAAGAPEKGARMLFPTKKVGIFFFFFNLSLKMPPTETAAHPRARSIKKIYIYIFRLIKVSSGSWRWF